MTKPSYPGPESIHRQQLTNGLTVLLYENHVADVVLIDCLWYAGSLGEQPGQAGLADFTTALLMRGTAGRNFAAIYEDLEAVGASLDFDSGRHTAQFTAHCLREDLDLVLDLATDCLLNPTFPPDQVERVRGEILTGLAIRASDTRQMARLAFQELLYGVEHPYGRSQRGYETTIAPLSRQDLVDYHRRFYGPRDGIVVVVGAITAAEALPRLEASLGRWRNDGQATLPPLPPVNRPEGLRRRYVPINDKTQCDLVLGLPGPPRSAPDYLDLSLANTVLGVFGMMGRLGQRVREEQGLAYYIHSRLQSSLGPTPWTVGTGVAPEKVDQAVASIRAEIRRLQEEPVPEAELADSQAYRSGSLPVSLETNEGLARVIMDMEFLGLGLDYLQRFPALVQAITPARIQAAAQKYLSADQLALAISGPPGGDGSSP